MSVSERLALAAAAALQAMPEEVRSECATLADLSPEDRGVRVFYDAERDFFDLVWVGRWLASVPGDAARGEAAE